MYVDHAPGTGLEVRSRWRKAQSRWREARSRWREARCLRRRWAFAGAAFVILLAHGPFTPQVMNCANMRSALNSALTAVFAWAAVWPGSEVSVTAESANSVTRA